MKCNFIKIILLLSVLFGLQKSHAQAPQKMSFQAAIRNASNQPVISGNVGIKISILLGSPTGAVVYSETQNVITNANGLASLTIGEGTVVLGAFQTIVWSSATHFIRTEIDPTGGTNYTVTNTSQLLSVPYALHANTVSNITETDPQVNSATNRRVPKWNGIALVDGIIQDNGVGLGVNTAPVEGIDLSVNGKVKMAELQITNGAANGYVLQSGTNGSTTWVDPASLSVTENDPKVGSINLNKIPKWNETALVDGSITDYQGKIGIGNSDPFYLLSVGSNIDSNLNNIASFNTTANKPILIGETTNFKGLMLGYDGNNIQGRSGIQFPDNDHLILNNYGGNVGIGTSNPTSKLEVNGNTKTTAIQLTNGASTGYVLRSDATGNGTWVDPNSLSITETDPQVTASVANLIPKWNGTALVDGQIFDNGTNIGIGTSAPSGKLHVVGKTIIDNGTIDFTNTGRSIFIGENAGINDDKSSNRNTFVGHSAGEQNTTGSRNVYIGNQAGQLNNGIGNVFIGSFAGALDTNTNNKFYLSNEFGNDLMSGDFISKMVTMNGSLGIGTTSTTQAKLVVNGANSNTIGATNGYGYLSRTTVANVSNSTTANYSIYSTDRIAASEFNAFSDARIKNIKGISNSKHDLETLSQIEITNYTLKDSISKGNNNYKKVIAQQVEKVYPQAVSKLTDVIPDIYQQAEMVNGFIALKNDVKQGEKIKIITQAGEQIVAVLEANSEGFKIDSNQTESVFVFGRQVSDFRSVDYEALSTLNISATQELLKKVQSLEATVKSISQENNTLKAEINDLSKVKNDVELLKKMLYAISSSNGQSTPLTSK